MDQVAILRCAMSMTQRALRTEYARLYQYATSLERAVDMYRTQSYQLQAEINLRRNSNDGHERRGTSNHQKTHRLIAGQ